ncbi:hypothetical protein BC938DRAFT_480651 [Jimgerdemannia flammicorona]|uniref:ATPase AAA-type core domain-containing protein n=1 Tax=Jimgerdemannia flammicorona TaxID=994334 RepID=A0A433QIR6_9FUNG|nr:hypothetical protein BC938DRAFT_480651 [Jimgerdemannia flammicorona]
MITLRSGRILKRVPVRHPHRPKLHQAQAPSVSDDGHNVKDTTVDDACYISPLRLTGLFDLWQTCKVLVVCGPPSSGKTVLAYKLIEHIGSQHDEESVMYVSLSEFVINSRMPNPETVFSNYWRAKAKTTTTWLQHTDANSTVRLIIDDVDVLSGLDIPYFWRRLYVEPGQHLRILLLSRLDPNQHNSNIFPLQYIRVTGMRWLCLTRNEVTAVTPRLALVGQRVAKSVDHNSWGGITKPNTTQSRVAKNNHDQSHYTVNVHDYERSHDRFVEGWKFRLARAGTRNPDST